MARNRRHVARFVIDKWGSPGDPELTQVLKELKVLFENVTSKATLGRFVTHVLSLDHPLLFRLKLYRHLLDKGNMMSHPYYSEGNGPKHYDRLENAYKSTFKEWWADQEKGFIMRFHDTTTLISELEKFKQQTGRILLTYNLHSDIELAIEASIQKIQQAEIFKSSDSLSPETPAIKVAPSDLTSIAMQWTGPINLLIDVMECFGRLKLLAPATVENRLEMICCHFVNEQGQPFKKKNLQELERITKNNGTKLHKGRPRRGPVIEAEIKRLMELQDHPVPED